MNLPNIPPRRPGGVYPRADAIEKHLADALERARRLQAALDYVLPYVHIDVRDQSLQIAKGEDQL
jgi:hypothetical protein